MDGDLLPPNATAAERAMSAAMSRLLQIPVPISSAKRAMQTDTKLLASLGWEFSVNEWSSFWDEGRKRAVVEASPAVHRVLGTAGALKRAVAALGYQVTVEEWFQYAGDPYTFRCTVDLDVTSLSEAEMASITRVCLDAKNVRSLFEGFTALRSQPGVIYIGIGGQHIVTRTFQPPVAPSFDYPGGFWIGIGQDTIVLSRTFPA